MSAEGQDGRRRRRRGSRESALKAKDGYALAVLLVGIAVMGILMSAVMPVWRHAAQREKEEELVFRGEQYARAVGLFQRKFAGAFPPSLDVLVEQRFLRRKYLDPMTADGAFQILYQGTAAQPGQVTVPGARPGTPGSSTPGTPPQPTTPGAGSPFAPGVTGARGGVIGVVSKSTAKSIRLYRGRSRYSEWQFLYTAVSAAAGAPGGASQPGRPAVPGQRAPGGAFPRTPGPGGQGPAGSPRIGMPPSGGQPGDPVTGRPGPVFPGRPQPPQPN